MDKKMLYRMIISDNATYPEYFKNNQAKLGYTKIESSVDSCNDHYHIYLKMKKHLIEDIYFNGNGCSISKSSLNLLIKNLIAKDWQKALEFLYNYRNMIKGQVFEKDNLNDLIAFENIHLHLNRIACALSGANSLIFWLKNYGKN